MTAEDFVKKHFKDIAKKTEWYVALVAVAEGYAHSELKTVERKISICKASINGALNGLQFDNTDDFIEKSVVIEQLQELLVILNKTT